MRPRFAAMILALFYAVFETAHFGWNLAPKSDAEMICDGIAVLVYALAYLCP